MSMVGRLKRALASKTKSTSKKSKDPKKELSRVIFELEEQKKRALKELLSYKTTQKQLEHEVARLSTEADSWDKRARDAVRAGQDDLAKKSLGEKRRCLAERDQIRRDQNEAAVYAAQLNQSRKDVEGRLRSLKLREGTLARQLSAARSGGSVVGDGRGAMDALDRAEHLIDEQAAEAELSADLDGGRGEADAELERATDEADADAALAALKAKMKAGRN